MYLQLENISIYVRVDGGWARVGKVPRCFGWFLPFIPVMPLNSKNKRAQTNKPYKERLRERRNHTGLAWRSMCWRKDLILVYRDQPVSPSASEPPRPPFILLLSITAVKTNPRPSEELSLDLREHPCNYIYLNRGQILAPTRGQGLLHFPARGNLRSMCVCAKYILQAWNNCEESAELESLFTRQTFASTFQIRFRWSFWTVPDFWKWDRFPFFLICSNEENFFRPFLQTVYL